MDIPELIQLIGSFCDPHSLTRVSCINRMWYAALEPLRHKAYAIPFSGWPRRPWECVDEKYKSFKEDPKQLYRCEEQSDDEDAPPKMAEEVERRKACAEFKKRRHLVRELQLGHHKYPGEGGYCEYQRDRTLRAYNKQLKRLLFSDASRETGETALTNLTTLVGYQVPLSILLPDLDAGSIFKFWNQPTLHTCSESAVQEATLNIFKTNRRLSTVSMTQLSMVQEDGFDEYPMFFRETPHMALELYNFLASLSQAPVLCHLTSLSLIKFDWPKCSMSRLLIILRQKTPNLKELNIVFRLFNTVNELQMEDLPLTEEQAQLPPLTVTKLFMSSLNPTLRDSFLEQVHTDTPMDVYYAEHNQAKQALLSFLRQFPLLEEWRFTESDCRNRKSSLNIRSTLGTSAESSAVVYEGEPSQRLQYHTDGSYSYYWYTSQGPTAATEFCRDIQKVCPRLKRLDFSEYRTFRPAVMQAFIDTYGGQLEELDMFANPGFSAAVLVQAVRVCTNLTSLDISFCAREFDYAEEEYGTPYLPISDYTSRYDDIEPNYEDDGGDRMPFMQRQDTHGRIFPLPSQETQGHLRAIGPRYRISGREASLALWRLPHLKRFYAQGVPIDARDLLFDYDIAGWDKPPKEQDWRVTIPNPWGEWACKGLEELCICVMVPNGAPGYDQRDEFIMNEVTVSNDFPVATRQCYMNPADGTKPPASKASAKDVRNLYQVRVMEQIGRLTQLRELLLEGHEEWLERNMSERMGHLTLTVETGLPALAPLAHTLERLCVPKLKEKLAGRAEVEWIAKNLYHTPLSPPGLPKRKKSKKAKNKEAQPGKQQGSTRTRFVELLGLSRDTISSPREVHKNVAWLRQECPGLRVELLPPPKDYELQYAGGYQDY